VDKLFEWQLFKDISMKEVSVRDYLNSRSKVPLPVIIICQRSKKSKNLSQQKSHSTFYITVSLCFLGTFALLLYRIGLILTVATFTAQVDNFSNVFQKVVQHT